ncbi:ParB/RepB/Spo0J family partition protein [Oleisolibacter albus]|uniref:ParB/RepB/Spo0J family partition protein n=1 Tax=Oleisolibacter albus TaxID=2171757 RepID=UPI000DF39C6D|nr:ParB/RepB/Spo0J family partition protein [Oleisolibacter albus]
MAAKTRKPSPLLQSFGQQAQERKAGIITSDSRFNHSFEAAVDRIHPDPNQARRRFDEEEVRSLAATMADKGQLQPVLLADDPERHGHFVLVAGERRWRAARLLGWDSLLAIRYEGDRRVAALIENLQRVDLSPIEEARGLRQLMRDEGLNQVQVAAALGKGKRDISATLSILGLPDTLLDQLAAAGAAGGPEVSKNLLVEVATAAEPVQARLIPLLLSGKLTVRAAREAKAGADALSRPATKPAPRLSPAAVQGLTQRIEAMRSAATLLKPRDREGLSRLRDAIDALLGKG